MIDLRTFLTVPRPKGEELRLGLAEYESRHFGSLGLWFHNAEGEWCPLPRA